MYWQMPRDVLWFWNVAPKMLSRLDLWFASLLGVLALVSVWNTARGLANALLVVSTKAGFHNGSCEICSAVAGFCIELLQLNICLGTETLQSFLLWTEEFKIHIRNGNTCQAVKIWYNCSCLVYVHILILKKYDDDCKWEQIEKGIKFIVGLPAEFWKRDSGIILHSTVVGHYKGEQNHMWCV